MLGIFKRLRSNAKTSRTASRKLYRGLSYLDDRTLKDIGLCRSGSIAREFITCSRDGSQ